MWNTSVVRIGLLPQHLPGRPSVKLRKTSLETVVSWFTYELDTIQTQVKTVTATATFFGLFFTRRQLNNKHNINLSHTWRKHRLQSHNIKYEYDRAMLLALWTTLYVCHIHEQPNIFVKCTNHHQMRFNFYVFLITMFTNMFRPVIRPTSGWRYTFNVSPSLHNIP